MARTHQQPCSFAPDGRRGAEEKDRGNWPAEEPAGRAEDAGRDSGTKARRPLPVPERGTLGIETVVPRGPAAPRAGGQSLQPPRGRLPWEGRWRGAPCVAAFPRSKNPASQHRFADTEVWRCCEPKRHHLEHKSSKLIPSSVIQKV